MVRHKTTRTLALLFFLILTPLLTTACCHAPSKVDTASAEACYQRGNAHFDQGQYGQAISDFTKALELNPKYAEAYYNKAVACEKVGRTKEAIEAYKSFLKHASPESSFIEKARERIKELSKP